MAAEDFPDDDDDLPDEPDDSSDDEAEEEAPADDAEEDAADDEAEEEVTDEEEDVADEEDEVEEEEAADETTDEVDEETDEEDEVDEEDASDETTDEVDEEEAADETTDEVDEETDEEDEADEEETSDEATDEVDEEETSDETTADEEDEVDEEEASDEETTAGEQETADEEEEEADDELAAEPAEPDLPSLADDVFGSRADYPDAAEDDFDDDAGDWTEDDYHGVAQTLFGTHEHFGDTAEKRWLDDGYLRSELADSFFASAVERVPEARGVQFFEREGQIIPRGVLTTVALALLEVAFPDLDLSRLHVTIPSRPSRPISDDDGSSVAPPSRRELPDALKNLPTAESVDLRKYASPIGDQGSTSRCAAFAWTHAMEMLGNVQGKPFPRLACSFTMLRFQQRQGDVKDFAWAYKGGDGTSGTWEPGHHVFTTGTCREELWPNDKKQPHVTTEEMEGDAQNHRLEVDVYDITVDDMKKLLTAGLPVQISMATGEKFSDIGRDGVLNAAEKPSGQHGYHAMLCVGYVGNYFIIKNSWGDDWGDAGYCYIPKMVLQQSEPEPVAIVPRRRIQAPPPGGPPPAQGFPPAQRAQAAPAGRPPEPAPVAAPVPVPVPPPAPVSTLASCPHCAVSVSSGKFCSSCGRPLAQKRFCTQCGTPREGAARFCPACGTSHGS